MCDAGAQENKWFGRCLPISSGPAWDVGAACVWADVVGLGVPRTGRRNEHINVMSSKWTFEDREDEDIRTFDSPTEIKDLVWVLFESNPATLYIYNSFTFGCLGHFLNLKSYIISISPFGHDDLSKAILYMVH